MDNQASGLKIKRLPKWKLLLFAIAPVCLLLVTAEIVVRAAGLANPQLKTLALAEETAGLYVRDPDLFWSLKPELNAEYYGATVRTNLHGLRAPEIRPKRRTEFRILSLGESSTFGKGVSNEETYTSALPALLQNHMPASNITALNAGVPSWSSFQSLKYLELRGLALKPDLVIFYHELNDYLPSSLRDSNNTEIGVVKTDRELYESRRHTLLRGVMNFSALVRMLQSRYAMSRIEAFDREGFENPLTAIGLPDIGLPGRLVRAEDGEQHDAQIDEKLLGQRVSEEERGQILIDLVQLCQDHDIRLVIIHPSYSDSTQHECLLTRFCQDHHVLMFDAHDSLHPPSESRGALFLDSWHPNPRGHARLAEGLVGFLIKDQSFLGLHSVEEATKHLREALREDPEALDVQLRLAQLLMQTGQYQEAVPLLDKIVLKKPDHAEAHEQLGFCLLQLGRLDEAQGHFQTALRLAPNSLNAHSNLGRTLLLQKQYEQAVTHYEEALRLQPDHLVVLNDLAWLLATCSESDVRDGRRAVKLAVEAARITGYKNISLLDTLSAAHAEAGDFEAAARWQKRAVELAPPEKKEALRRRLDQYNAGKPFRDVPAKANQEK